MCFAALGACTGLTQPPRFAGHQRCTQSYVRRPYGVGLLVGGYDKATGAHLYRTCPSGNFYEYSAYAIGARSQSARTYLEKKYETFPDGMVLRVMLLTPVAAHKCLTLCGVCVAASVDELISHALKALSGCTESDKELTTRNTTIAIVGKDLPFKIIDEEDVAPYVGCWLVCCRLRMAIVCLTVSPPRCVIPVG